MTKQAHPFDGLEAGYFERLPEAMRAAYTAWLVTDGAVPLEALLVHASATLRRAVDTGGAVDLDFSELVRAALSASRDASVAEAA